MNRNPNIQNKTKGIPAKLKVQNDKNFQRALSLHQGGNFAQAKVIYESIIKLEPNNFNAIQLLATILAQQGDFEQSIDMLKSAIKANPQIPELYHNLGFALQGVNNLEEALFNFDKAISLKKNYPEAHHNKAIILDYLNRLDESIKSFDDAISLKKNYVEAYCNRGVVLQKLDKLNESADSYVKAISIDKNHFKAYNNLGVVKRLQFNYDEAINNFNKSIEINKKFHIAYTNLGLTYLNLKDFLKALHYLDLSITMESKYADSWCNKGLVLIELEKYEEALECFNTALELDANNKSYLCNKGLALNSLKRYKEAIQFYDKSLSIDNLYYESLLNKGVTLRNLEFYNDSIINFDKAIEADINKPNAWSNKGVTLSGIKRFEEAVICHKRAIGLKPAIGEYRNNLSHTYLSMANFKDGWKEYEWRWDTKKFEGQKPNFSKPVWNGEKTQQTVFIWAEQGLGDQILYSSVFTELSHYLPNVIVGLDKRLIPIYQRSFPNLKFVDRNEKLSEDEFDFQIPIGSTVQFFRSNLNDFEKSTFPYLAYETAKNLEIINKFKNSGKLICGISWRSANPDIGDYKSIPLNAFDTLLSSEKLQFINLQYKSDLVKESVITKYRSNIYDVNEVDIYNDIDSLASIIQACDIVITCSNTTAHLAGALNKKTLLILPVAAGRFWYWSDVAGKSIWYPSVKVFHQKVARNWEDPINEIEEFMKNRT